MTAPSPRGGSRVPSEAALALRQIRPWLYGVGFFSAVINLLMLTGALYMLQLYDRVLTSRSLATLVAISLIALAAFGTQGVLDAIRARMLVRIGARFDEMVAPGAFDAVTRLSLKGASSGQAIQPVRDVENIRGFLSGLGPTALFDMPFMPLFLAACFLLHPGLGWLALAGGVVIIVLTISVDLLSRIAAKETQSHAMERHVVVDMARRNAEAIAAMGFRHAVQNRWSDINARYVAGSLRVAATAGSFGSAAKIFRLMLQSAILGLGTYYAIHQEISAGAIIAAAIMSSRALAPIEIAIAHWRSFVASRQSYVRLRESLENLASVAPPLALAKPRRSLAVEEIYVAAPGGKRPILQSISFRLAAGSALGIIGPSGAGKSTLARTLVGVWPVASGTVRLDGAALDQWAEDQRGRFVGYLPQDVELFDGSVAENIGRFDPEASPEAIVAAAQTAGAHDLIVRFPQGYDTLIGEGGAKLSGGQRQRVALARALYGDPFLVVLDEPNSNLDAEGERALASAIQAVRQRRGIVVMITHSGYAIESANVIGLMRDGGFVEFGSKDEVAKKLALLAPAARVAPARAASAPRAKPEDTVVEFSRPERQVS
jgi:ATP-binding cassette subfamily C protein PrsD